MTRWLERMHSCNAKKLEIVELHEQPGAILYDDDFQKTPFAVRDMHGYCRIRALKLVQMSGIRSLPAPILECPPAGRPSILTSRHEKVAWACCARSPLCTRRFLRSRHRPRVSLTRLVLQRLFMPKSGHPILDSMDGTHPFLPRIFHIGWSKMSSLN
jgi:hypothetical protein